jgi:hypothetical protein
LSTKFYSRNYKRGLLFQESFSKAGAVTKKKNFLAEEDEVDFLSCCGAETIEFVVPPKRFKLNILFHGLISGAMCGLTLWYDLLVVTLTFISNKK